MGRGAGVTDEGSGTTVTGAALGSISDEPAWIVFNIGDSRVYRLVGGVLEQLTVDHSIVQELVDAGQITREEADTHPHSNVITRAVGVPRGADPRLPGDRGRGGHAPAHLLRRAHEGAHVLRHPRTSCVANAKPEQAARQLVEAALGNGGRDNVTVVVVDVLKVVRPSRAPDDGRERRQRHRLTDAAGARGDQAHGCTGAASRRCGIRCRSTMGAPGAAGHPGGAERIERWEDRDEASAVHPAEPARVRVHPRARLRRVRRRLPLRAEHAAAPRRREGAARRGRQRRGAADVPGRGEPHGPAVARTRRSSRSTRRASRPTAGRTSSWSTARRRSASATAPSSCRSPRCSRSACGSPAPSRPRTGQGVLHRDIKPSNILTTAYGHPGALRLRHRRDPRRGRDDRGGRPVDPVVGARGAARRDRRHRRERGVVARRDRLLAARRPVPVRGPRRRQRVDRAHVAHREGEAAADGPRRRAASLERGARARDVEAPEDRQASALEFIRDLQAVEEELGLPQTPLEVAMDDWALATAVDLDDRTRIGGSARGRRGDGARRRRRAAAAARGPAPSRGATPARTRHDRPRRRTRAADHAAPRLGHLVAAALLVALVGAGVVAVVHRARAASRWSPTCRAPIDGTVVSSRWNDPGIAERRRVRRDGRRRRVAACSASRASSCTARGRRPGVRHRHGQPRRQVRRRRAPSAASTSRRAAGDAAPALGAHRSAPRDGGRGRRSSSRVVAGVAVVSGGYTAQRVDLGDAAVWVANDGRRPSGGPTPRVLELNSVVETGGPRAEVVQQGSTVLVLDRDRATVGIVDATTSTVTETRRGAARGPRGRARRGPRGRRVRRRRVVHARRRVRGVRQRRGARCSPSARVSVTSVDPAGVLFAYTPSTGRVARVDAADAEPSRRGGSSRRPRMTRRCRSRRSSGPGSCSTRPPGVSGRGARGGPVGRARRRRRPCSRRPRSRAIGRHRVPPRAPLGRPRRRRAPVVLADGVSGPRRRRSSTTDPSTPRGRAARRGARAGRERDGRAGRATGAGALAFLANGDALVLNDRAAARLGGLRRLRLIDNWDELLAISATTRRRAERPRRRRRRSRRAKYPGGRRRRVRRPARAGRRSSRAPQRLRRERRRARRRRGRRRTAARRRLDLVANNQQLQLTLDDAASGRSRSATRRRRPRRHRATPS